MQGTVHNIRDAVNWLAYTYYYIRIRLSREYAHTLVKNLGKQLAPLFEFLLTQRFQRGDIHHLFRGVLLYYPQNG